MLSSPSPTKKLKTVVQDAASNDLAWGNEVDNSALSRAAEESEESFLSQSPKESVNSMQGQVSEETLNNDTCSEAQVPANLLH